MILQGLPDNFLKEFFLSHDQLTLFSFTFFRLATTNIFTCILYILPVLPLLQDCVYTTHASVIPRTILYLYDSSEDGSANAVITKMTSY